MDILSTCTIQLLKSLRFQAVAMAHRSPAAPGHDLPDNPTPSSSPKRHISSPKPPPSSPTPARAAVASTAWPKLPATLDPRAPPTPAPIAARSFEPAAALAEAVAVAVAVGVLVPTMVAAALVSFGAVEPDVRLSITDPTRDRERRAAALGGDVAGAAGEVDGVAAGFGRRERGRSDPVSAVDLDGGIVGRGGVVSWAYGGGWTHHPDGIWRSRHFATRDLCSFLWR